MTVLNNSLRDIQVTHINPIYIPGVFYFGVGKYLLTVKCVHRYTYDSSYIHVYN